MLHRGLLATALESVDAGVHSWDPTSGEAQWDARLRSLFGFDLDEPATHAALLDRVHPDDRARVEDAVADAADARRLPALFGRVSHLPRRRRSTALDQQHGLRGVRGRPARACRRHRARRHGAAPGRGRVTRQRAAVRDVGRGLAGAALGQRPRRRRVRQPCLSRVRRRRVRPRSARLRLESIRAPGRSR